MATPPARDDDSRRQSSLRERALSYGTSHGIRIVPYTPPRIAHDHDRSASHSSAGTAPARPSQRPHSLPLQPHFQSGTAAAAPANEKTQGPSEGGASRSWSSAAQLAGAKQHVVSGAKPASASSKPNPTTPLRAPAIRPHTLVPPPPPPPRQSASSRRLAVPQPEARADDTDGPIPSVSDAAPLTRPGSRRRNFVAIQSDKKTFTLVPLAKTGFFAGSASGSASSHGRISDPRSSLGSSSVTSPMSTVRTSGSNEALSDTFTDDRPNSPSSSAGTIPDQTQFPSPPSPAPPSAQLAEDHITPQSSSPWNYRMVGGVRKVPNTPDKRKASHFLSSERESSLSPLLEAASSSSTHEAEDTPTHPLATKPSFASEQSTSTLSDANYKVYGHSSPAQQSLETLPPSSSHSNFHLLGESSPVVAEFDHSSINPPGSSGSDDNYVLYGEPSPSPAASLVGRPRPKYSQESLVVPPLQPTRKRSNEKFGYYKSRSRENLRRADSARSIQSISSVLSPDPTRNVFVGSAGEGPSGAARQQHDSCSSTAASGSGTDAQTQPDPMVEAHPHQWSSQLSTVMSEDEGSGASRTRSRSTLTQGGSISGSGSGSGPHRRNSSGWASSTHSRQVLSISSSMAGQLEDSRSVSRSLSHSDNTIERPGAAYTRGNGYGGDRTIRDQDEHGDGLTELMSARPSRSGLSGFLSSDSSRNLHSSSSSRSFNSNSLPIWARVYYGSGERRQLSAPSISDDGSRPSSAFRPDSGSPNMEHFPVSIYTPRRRVNEVRPASNQRPFSDAASIDEDNGPRPIRLGPGLRKKASSIWSPHLRYDRRASRYSPWEPPSVAWSAESGLLGRRNSQVVLFVIGFVFPLAWMVAAMLPLPAAPQLQMLERDNSQSELGIPDAFRRDVAPMDEVRYQSARWWRNLNRCMSVVGLIIIGVVIGLVVVGVREGWYQPERT